MSCVLWVLLCPLLHHIWIALSSNERGGGVSNLPQTKIHSCLWDDLTCNSFLSFSFPAVETRLRSFSFPCCKSLKPNGTYLDGDWWVPIRGKVEAVRTTQKIKSWGYEDYSKDLLNWRLVRLESVKFTLFTLWTSMLLCSLQDKTSKKAQGTIVSKREVKHFFEIDQLAIIQFVLLRSTLYGLYWLKLGGCSSAAHLCSTQCVVGWHVR